MPPSPDESARRPDERLDTPGSHEHEVMRLIASVPHQRRFAAGLVISPLTAKRFRCWFARRGPAVASLPGGRLQVLLGDHVRALLPEGVQVFERRSIKSGTRGQWYLHQ